MNRLKHIVLRCLMMGLIGHLSYASAASINSVNLTVDSLEALPNCLHYQVVGTCFWLVCGVGCSVKETLKVDHYLPDVVVTVYPAYKKDPWGLVNDTVDVAGHLAGNALFKAFNHGLSIKEGAINSPGSADNNLRFREVDVIGNPALAVFNEGDFLLSGQSDPLMPYFQSQWDALEWRSGRLESLYPQTWMPGKDVVGHFLTDNWGSVYPREGFLMQANVGKASAVYAVRAANIISHRSFDHMDKDLAAEPCPEKDCTTPGVILSDSPKTEWQMVLPTHERVCHAKIDPVSNPSWTKKQAEDQSYSWIIWREYRGCLKGPGVFLGSIGG